MTGTAAHIAELCRLFVFVTLAAAAVGKTIDIGPFVAATAELLGLSRSIARYVAYTIVGAEASVAVLLLAGGSLARIGMPAAILLFLTFTAVVAVALVRRRAVHCNCFGGRGHTISVHDLLRNGILIAAGGCFLLYSVPGTPPVPTASLLLLGIALILFLISAHLRDILSILSLSREA